MLFLWRKYRDVLKRCNSQFFVFLSEFSPILTFKAYWSRLCALRKHFSRQIGEIFLRVPPGWHLSLVPMMCGYSKAQLKWVSTLGTIFHCDQSAFGFTSDVSQYRTILALIAFGRRKGGPWTFAIISAIRQDMTHPTPTSNLEPQSLLPGPHWYGIFWLVLQGLQVAFALRFNCQLNFRNTPCGVDC